MIFFNNCTTKAEAKALYYALAKCFHPDKGGNADLMIALKKQYDTWSPHKYNSSNWQSQFTSVEKAFSNAERVEDMLYIQRLEKRVDELNEKNDELGKEVDAYQKLNLFQRFIFALFGNVYVKSKIDI